MGFNLNSNVHKLNVMLHYVCVVCSDYFQSVLILSFNLNDTFSLHVAKKMKCQLCFDKTIYLIKL